MAGATLCKCHADARKAGGKNSPGPPSFFCQLPARVQRSDFLGEDAGRLWANWVVCGPIAFRQELRKGNSSCAGRNSRYLPGVSLPLFLACDHQGSPRKSMHPARGVSVEKGSIIVCMMSYSNDPAGCSTRTCPLNRHHPRAL